MLARRWRLHSKSAKWVLHFWPSDANNIAGFLLVESRVLVSSSPGLDSRHVTSGVPQWPTFPWRAVTKNVTWRESEPGELETNTLPLFVAWLCCAVLNVRCHAILLSKLQMSTTVSLVSTVGCYTADSRDVWRVKRHYILRHEKGYCAKNRPLEYRVVLSRSPCSDSRVKLTRSSVYHRPLQTSLFINGFLGQGVSHRWVLSLDSRLCFDNVVNVWAWRSWFIWDHHSTCHAVSRPAFCL